MNCDKSLLLAAVLAVGGFACDQDPTPIGGFDTDGCSHADGADGVDGGDAADGGEVVEMVIDCSLSYQGVPQDVRLVANNPEGAGEDVFVNISDTLGFFGEYRDDEFEGRSLRVSVRTGEDVQIFTSLYQLDRTQRPVNEFLGDHGFTGLNAVKDPANSENLQFACFAMDPADPIHSWDE
jgi:hypothetical protein